MARVAKIGQRFAFVDTTGAFADPEDTRTDYSSDLAMITVINQGSRTLAVGDDVSIYFDQRLRSWATALSRWL
jgi:hypothetical protein